MVISANLKKIVGSSLRDGKLTRPELERIIREVKKDGITNEEISYLANLAISDKITKEPPIKITLGSRRFSTTARKILDAASFTWTPKSGQLVSVQDVSKFSAKYIVNTFARSSSPDPSQKTAQAFCTFRRGSLVIKIQFEVAASNKVRLLRYTAFKKGKSVRLSSADINKIWQHVRKTKKLTSANTTVVDARKHRNERQFLNSI